MSHISIHKASIIPVGLMLFFVFFSRVNAASDEGLLEIRFNHPLSEVELDNLIDRYGGTVKELYFEHGDIQGGYTLAADELTYQAFKELQREHLHLIESMISDESLLSDEVASKREEKLKSDLKKSELLTKDGVFEVSGIVIGNIQDSSDLASDSSIKKIVPKEKLSKNGDISIAATSYYVAARLWYPTKGTAKVDKGLAYNTFYFNDASGLDLFGGILTYEHETQIYDAKFVDYGGYWSSNLPNAYKDTPFLDTMDNFTIGSSKASNIVSNTKYYTSMSFKSGTASTATVRIKGQLGHRYPSGCYSTWCVFADMTTPTLKLFTAPITSSVSWTYTP